MKKRSLLFIGLFNLSVVFIFSIICAPVSTWGGSKPGKPLSPTLIGTWQVTEVHIDRGTSRRLHVQRNDPALKGRLLTISNKKMTSDISYGDVCDEATALSNRMTAGDLIKSSMGRRWITPEIPTAKDFELPVAENEPLEVLSVSCKDGLWGSELGRREGIRGAWIVVLPEGQLAMRWYDESILILSRLPEDAKPKASFNCSKASTPAEKTICGSIELSSFDCSVAESYFDAVRYFQKGNDSKGLRRLKAAQKAWLSKRNACGTDANCLRKSMEKQLDVLAEPEKFSPL